MFMNSTESFENRGYCLLCVRMFHILGSELVLGYCTSQSLVMKMNILAIGTLVTIISEGTFLMKCLEIWTEHIVTKSKKLELLRFNSNEQVFFF